MTTDFAPYMSDLRSRVQRTRENFSSTVEHFASLKERMMQQRANVDAGRINRMYARQGYLYRRAPGGRRLNVKTMAATAAAGGAIMRWTKCYAQFRSQGRALTLIDYSQQAGGRIASTEEVRVTECACAETAAAADSPGVADKFRFIVSGEDLETVSGREGFFFLFKDRLIFMVVWISQVPT